MRLADTKKIEVSIVDARDNVRETKAGVAVQISQTGKERMGCSMSSLFIYV